MSTDSGAPRSPYVGLIPYNEKDAPYFYGRSREQRLVMANLRGARLTVMFGASGVGKSSVLLAGVAPKLRELARPPARHPAGRNGGTLLAEKPLFAASYFNAWHDEPLPRLVDTVRRSAEGVLDGVSLERWRPGTPLTETFEAWTNEVRTLLIVLDQFEEYFLYHPGQKGPGTLADELPAIVNDPNLRVNVLLSIREDSLATLDRFKGVIPHLYANTLRIDYLDRTAAEEAIRGPVDEYNRRRPDDTPEIGLRRDLVEAVLDATRTGRLALGTQLADRGASDGGPEPRAEDEVERVETPFLQLVMDRLWRATTDNGETELTLETLYGLGGAERIVERHLADALDTLEPREEEIAAGAFKYLVTPSKSKVAHTASDLAYWTKSDVDEVTDVLHRLSTSSCGHILRTLRPAPGQREPRYEIFHDVLGAAVLEWSRRHDQEREKRELAAQAAAEQEAERAAEAERQRKLRARNRIAVWAAVVLGILVLCLAATVLWVVHQRRMADSQKSVAASRASLATDPERSVALALKALGHSETAEAEDALRTALSASRLRAMAGTGRPRPCGPVCAVGPARDVKSYLANTVAPGTAAWSPDGTFVASGEVDGSVRTWSPETGTVRRSPAKPSGDPVLTVAVSPDGHWVASVDSGGHARLWAPADGRTRELATTGGAAVAFSADGRYVAAATDAGTRIWHLESGSQASLRSAGSQSVSVAFSPAGDRLAAVGWDGPAHVWDLGYPGTAPRALRRGKPLTTYPGMVNVAFSRSGREVLAPVVDDGDHALGIFDATTGTRRGDAIASGEPAGDTLSQGASFFGPKDDFELTLFRKSPGLFYPGGGYNHLNGHPDFVAAAAFSPDGRHLATASRDGTARIWDVASALPLVVLTGHVGQVDGVSFSPDGRFVATHSLDDGTTRLWSVDLGRTLYGSTDWVLSASWSPDGRRVAAAGNDGSIRIYTPGDGDRLKLPGYTIVHNVRFSPSGHQVVASSAEGTKVYDTTAGAPPRWVETGLTATYWAEYSPDGRRIVTVNQGTKHPVSLYDANTLKQLPFPLRDMSVSQARYSPDGKQLALITDRAILIVDARTARTVRTLKGHRGTIGTVAFSPDGRRLASGAQDRTVRVWDLRTGRSVAVMTGHEGWIAGVDFDPSGRMVTSASADGTTRVWNVATGRLLSVLRNQADSVNSAEFNPRDSSIASASDDRTVVITRCETCASLSRLKALAKARVWQATDGG